MRGPTFDPIIGREFIGRVRELARHSDSTTNYTRTYLTPAHQDASRRIAQWMREAGMAVRVDAVGSVIGRYEAGAQGAKTLLGARNKHHGHATPGQGVRKGAANA